MGWKSISRGYCWWHKTVIPANNHPEWYVRIENTIVSYIMPLVGESYQIPLSALDEVLDISFRWCVNNIQLNIEENTVQSTSMNHSTTYSAFQRTIHSRAILGKLLIPLTCTNYWTATQFGHLPCHQNMSMNQTSIDKPKIETQEI